MRRNNVWIISGGAPRPARPGVFRADVFRVRAWKEEAIAGARLRHGKDVDVSEGAVSVDGAPAGICLVAAGVDGVKTVLARFARSIITE